MSYDVSLIAETLDGAPVTVFDMNMTSNCAPAWDAAGCVLRDFDKARAAELLPHALRAAVRLRDTPEEYQGLVRGGGEWGTAATAEEFMRQIAEACAVHPSALVSICR